LSNAARAGVPQVLVPHLLDQFFWASRVAPLQIGPRPIPRGRLDVARLSAALRELVGNTRYAEAARLLSRQVIHDRVDRAVSALESLAAGGRSGPDGVAVAAR
jgi:sterol 3beta-glucosyltransferase